MHIPALISDLAVMLITAGLITILFKKIKQPLVPVSYTHLRAHET